MPAQPLKGPGRCPSCGSTTAVREELRKLEAIFRSHDKVLGDKTTMVGALARLHDDYVGTAKGSRRFFCNWCHPEEAKDEHEEECPWAVLAPLLNRRRDRKRLASEKAVEDFQT